jgi:hypothetical protein
MEAQIIELAQALTRDLSRPRSVEWGTAPEIRKIRFFAYRGHAYTPGPEGTPIGTFREEGAAGEEARVYASQVHCTAEPPWRDMFLKQIVSRF